MGKKHYADDSGNHMTDPKWPFSRTQWGLEHRLSSSPHPFSPLGQTPFPLCTSHLHLQTDVLNHAGDFCPAQSQECSVSNEPTVQMTGTAQDAPSSFPLNLSLCRTTASWTWDFRPETDHWEPSSTYSYTLTFRWAPASSGALTLLRVLVPGPSH